MRLLALCLSMALVACATGRNGQIANPRPHQLRTEGEATQVILRDLHDILRVVPQGDRSQPRGPITVKRLEVFIHPSAKELDLESVTSAAAAEVRTWSEASAQLEIFNGASGEGRDGPKPTVSLSWSMSREGFRVVVAFHNGTSNRSSGTMGEPFVWVDRLASRTVSGGLLLEPPWGGFGYGYVYPIGIDGVFGLDPQSVTTHYPRLRYSELPRSSPAGPGAEAAESAPR